MKLSFDNENAVYEKNGTFTRIPVKELAYNLFNVYSLTGENHNPRLLPSNVRWISDNGLSFLVERPPCQIMINYKKGKPGLNHRGEEETFLISLPWQIYFLNVSTNEISIYFRNESIISLKDNLYNTCISNIFDTGLACLGAQQVKEISELKEMQVDSSEIINYMINSFWMNEFNDDLRIPVKCLPEEMLLDEIILEKIKNEAVISGYEPEIAEQMIESGDFSTLWADAYSVYSYLSRLTLDEVIALSWSESSESLETKTSPVSFFNNSNWTLFLRDLFLTAAHNPNPNFAETEEEHYPEDEENNTPTERVSSWSMAEDELHYLVGQIDRALAMNIINLALIGNFTTVETPTLRALTELNRAAAESGEI